MFVLGIRGVGKTFNTLDFLVKRYIRCGEQFIYLRRTKEDLDQVAPKLFVDIERLECYNEYKLEVKNYTLYCNGEIMGYMMALTKHNSYKSNAYPNVYWAMYEEFIAEKGGYTVKDECQMFASIYETVARFRRMRVFFLANTVTINNLYFNYFQVKPVRGSRFNTFGDDVSIVIEMAADKEYSDAKAATEWGQLMKRTPHYDYMYENQFLLDNYSFITGAPKGASNYVCTILFNGRQYGVRKYDTCYYVSKKIDPECKRKYTFNSNDHQSNYLMFKNIKENPLFVRMLEYYRHGGLLFDSQNAKLDIFEILNI